MFSMCSELTPRAPIPDTRIPQLMQPCSNLVIKPTIYSYSDYEAKELHLHFRLDPLCKIKSDPLLGYVGIVKGIREHE